MARPKVIVSNEIGRVPRARIRAAAKKVFAERGTRSHRPVRNLTKSMTASGRGVIAFKIPTPKRAASKIQKRG
jgi:hypothetical protein